jgi:hypothetical protein
MSLEDIRDPRGVPRWMEVGISGVPRQREWDVVRVVDLPELEGVSLSEVAFRLLGAGRAAGTTPADVPAAALARMAALVEETLEPPCEVRALRRGVLDWSVAARQITVELVDLPALEEVEEISVAVAPDGGRTILVDGEEAEPQGELEQVILELERQGRERFPAFVARVVQSTAGWELSVDPL